MKHGFLEMPTKRRARTKSDADAKSASVEPCFKEALANKDAMALARLCAGACLGDCKEAEEVISKAVRLIFACHATLTRGTESVEQVFKAVMATDNCVSPTEDETRAYLDTLLFDGRVAAKELKSISRIKGSKGFKKFSRNGKVHVKHIAEIVLPDLPVRRRQELWEKFLEDGIYCWPESIKHLDADSAAHIAHAFKKFTESFRQAIARRNRRSGAEKARLKKAEKSPWN